MLASGESSELTAAMQYQFADCTLDTNAHTLTRDGQAQSIEPQVFDLLHLLIRHAGELVTKDQLIAEIWGGRIVSESAMSARIAAARKAVGDDGKQQKVIRTVSRRGLQFVAALEGAANPAPVAETPAPTIRYATAEDGCKIAYAVSGNGPPLLRLAYYPTHLELEWQSKVERPFFERLMQTHTLIRIDQRGSGLSDIDITDFSVARTVRDAKAVLDALGIDRAAVIGESSGGMIAAAFAASYPAHVSHVITIGGYVDGRSRRGNDIDDAIMTMAQAGWETPGSAFMTGYLSVYFPSVPQELLLDWANMMQKSCRVENEVAGRSFFNNHSIAPELGKVEAPTLVVHSRDDAVHPLSEGQKMARGIPAAELMVMESRNHVPIHIEPSWENMMQAISAFLER